MEDLLQDTGKLRGFAPGKHRILYGKPQFIFLREGNVRPFQQVIFHRAVLPQLQQNALPVGVHQLLRGILPGQMKTLVKFHQDIVGREKLFFYFRLHFIDRLFGDQVVTGNGGPDIASVFRGGDLFHQNLLK